MKNTIKSFFNSFLSTALVLTLLFSISSTVFAEEKMEDNMKEALSTVKSRVEIPEELSKFSVSTDENKFDTGYNFIWETSQEAETDELIRISYCDGAILSYRYNEYSNNSQEDKPKFATKTDEQLIDIAYKHFKMLNPEIYDDLEHAKEIFPAEIQNISLFNDNATVVFTRTENGIPFYENTSYITLDKNTGELISASFSFWSDTDFVDPEDKLTEKEALEAYKKLTEITPYYYIDKDYETKTVSSRIIYRPDFSDEIDAFTGEISDFVDNENKYYGYFNSNDMAAPESMETESAGSGENFTEQELAEINEVKGLLTVEEITGKLLDMKFVNLDKGFKLERSSLNKNLWTDEYYYDLYYKTLDKEYFDCTLNAKTGEIEDFYRNYSNEDYDKKEKQVPNETANSAVKYFYPEIYREYTLQEAETDNDDEDYIDNSFYYNRFVNDTEVLNDFITVRFNNDGNVSSISKKYSETEFEKLPKFDENEAVKSLHEYDMLKHYYTGFQNKNNGEYETFLVYKIGSYTMNSDYELTNYNGSQVLEQKSDEISYSDIDESDWFFTDRIDKLMKYGIFLEPLENGEFSEEIYVTNLEMQKLIEAVTQNHYAIIYAENDDEKFYSSTEDEFELTKLDAVKMFVTAIDACEIAEKSAIFQTSCEDMKDSDDIGYVAIAEALGFTGAYMRNEKFNPDEKISRELALEIIHEYVNLNS